MSSERLVGFFVLFGLVTLVFFIFFPEKSVSNQSILENKKIESVEKNYKNPDKKLLSFDLEFESFDESDFDFFVLKGNSFEDKKNAERSLKKLNDAGYPAFIEKSEKINNLYVVYVGPFLEKNDILNDIENIQIISESKNEEILRWNLSD